jgi:hypothetical protein
MWAIVPDAVVGMSHEKEVKISPKLDSARTEGLGGAHDAGTHRNYEN